MPPRPDEPFEPVFEHIRRGWLSLPSPARTRVGQVIRHPAAWFSMALLIALVDMEFGPWIMVPTLYVLPVLLAAWNGGLRWAIPMAIGLPFIHPLTFLQGHQAFWVSTLFINASIRAGALLMVAFLARWVAYSSRRIELLESTLPVCAWCRRMRQEDGSWVHLDAYLASRAHVDVTHGICPACLEKAKDEA